MQTIRMQLILGHLNKVVGGEFAPSHKPERDEAFTLDFHPDGQDGSSPIQLRLHPLDARRLHEQLTCLLRTAAKVVERFSHDDDPRMTR